MGTLIPELGIDNILGKMNHMGWNWKVTWRTNNLTIQLKQMKNKQSYDPIKTNEEQNN